MSNRLTILILLLWASQGPLAGTGMAETAVPRPLSMRPDFWVRGMPDAIQVNNYSCGVAVFQAVAQYFDHWGYQEKFAKQLGATPDDGTHPAAIIEGFRGLGLEAHLEEGLTLDRVKEYLRAGRVVIVDYQAWHGKPPVSDYTNEWEDGHYSILLGFNDRLLFLEDPSTLGTIGWLTNEEFLSRWHDYENENGRRREYVRMAIIVSGPARRQPLFTHID